MDFTGVANVRSRHDLQGGEPRLAVDGPPGGGRGNTRSAALLSRRRRAADAIARPHVQILVLACIVRQAHGVTVPALSTDEERVWRNLMRLVFLLPRALGEDLQRTCGLSSTQYSVLMHLSESPEAQLRMSDLAGRVSLSPSRITRVVDQMSSVGLVERRRPETSDGRSTMAVLTEQGRSALRQAWPHHLESVRTLAFDHLSAEETRTLGRILERLADHVEDPR